MRTRKRGRRSAKPNAANLENLLRQQESLREVIESISSELELRSLLTRIVRHACELLGADKGSVGLVDEERGVIRTEAVYQMPADELGAEMQPGVGLAGQVYLTRQAVILQRYGDVERPTQPRLSEDAVLGIPIFWRGRMIGFFGVGSGPPRRFDSHDAEVLSLFAKHAAIAIVNARRYEWEQRRTERLALIARVGRIITGDLLLDDLLQNAADAIHELLGYPNVAIPLIEPEDPETLVLTTVGGHYKGLVKKTYRIPITQGIIGAAARSRQIVLVNDVAADPRYLPTPGAVGIRAELAVPILLSERVLGVLNVESGDRFTDEDAASLRIIADQLAVAIENARLFAGMQRTLDEMQLLYKTSSRISTAMDVEEVIRAYLEQVAARGRYACSVVLYERDEAGQRSAVVVRGRWTHRDGLMLGEERFPYTFDALDPPLDAGETVAIADVHTDPRVSPELRRIQKASKRPALAMIPLLAYGQRIGLVVLSCPEIHDWQEDDLQRYEATAAQLATAIESRRQHLLLYESAQQVAVLEERQRLARELHDSVTQLLFSTTLIAQSIAPAWRRDSAEGERRVARLLELSRSALAEMRALLAELRPSEGASISAESALPSIVRVRQDGLGPALARHIATVARDGLSIALDARDYLPQPLEQEEALFRITQEALNNVVKHASARYVEVCLESDQKETRLTIRDDGVGFVHQGGVATISPSKDGGGLGMTTMRERAEALGGTVQILAAPQQGTNVTVTLPRKEERSQ